MNRQPVVAGQFYPDSTDTLQEMVRDYMGKEQVGEIDAPSKPALLIMVPHAGYIYSGSVAGRTFAQARLAKHVLLLGPNHTGRGQALALWGKGKWAVPGHNVPVNEELAQALLQVDERIVEDTEAHVGEHSLEVLLPFLVAQKPDVDIVPIAVAEPRLDVLLDVAGKVASVIGAWNESVSIVVSSDMSHYISHKEAKERDQLALEKVTAMDPEGLYRVVRGNNISMCGVLPMTLGLAICKKLGAREASVVAYGTSGETSGDYDRVVGYAGAVVRA